jgi:transposase
MSRIDRPCPSRARTVRAAAAARRVAGVSDVVRHTGLDITVYSSDTKRAAGHLSRQGPQLLRWALYESAKCAARPAAPGYGYYTMTRDRRTGGLATLSVARKLARRCYHTLRELGEEALAPAAKRDRPRAPPPRP